jgi:hypothetical protein
MNKGRKEGRKEEINEGRKEGKKEGRKERIILVDFFLCSSDGSFCVGKRSVVGGGDCVDLLLTAIPSLRYIL